MQGLEKLVAELQTPVAKVEGFDTEFAVVHDGYSLHDLQEYMSQPRRLKAAKTLHTEESFCRYVTLYKTAATLIMADVDQTRFLATLDYHGSSTEASHCDHTAVYSCPLSDEWKLWTGSDGTKFSQADFARFLEENLVDIVEPDGATIYEITRTLEAKKKVEFKSGVRLESGSVQLQYNEDVEAKGKGSLEIPATFKIGLPVFQGGERYELDAFLRYRIGDSGGLTFHYDLHRPHRVLEDAFARIATAINEAVSIEPMFGKT